MDMPAQVQAIENRAEVTGTVRRVAAHQAIKGYSLVTLDVESVASVSGYANLFEWAKGMSIEIAVPTADVTALDIAPDRHITWTIKRTTPGSAALVEGSAAKMPIQPVENQADVSGTIRALVERQDLPGYYTASIEVESTTAVANYPNMFTWAVGKSIDVNIPAAMVGSGEVATGQHVAWRVKKTGPTTAFLVPRRE
jgi:hypothetical protein